jgi:hypothetical protein
LKSRNPYQRRSQLSADTLRKSSQVRPGGRTRCPARARLPPPHSPVRTRARLQVVPSQLPSAPWNITSFRSHGGVRPRLSTCSQPSHPITSWPNGAVVSKAAARGRVSFVVWGRVCRTFWGRVRFPTVAQKLIFSPGFASSFSFAVEYYLLALNLGPDQDCATSHTHHGACAI